MNFLKIKPFTASIAAAKWMPVCHVTRSKASQFVRIAKKNVTGNMLNLCHQ